VVTVPCIVFSTILHLGELGYALSVSFGAVMDNPDLVVVCVVGDGEAETGPTATYVLTQPKAALS
jgi:phosphoketolase